MNNTEITTDHPEIKTGRSRVNYFGLGSESALNDYLSHHIKRGAWMNLIGVTVKHNGIGNKAGKGKGTIIKFDGEYVVIAFSQEDKKFQFPDAFENIISVDDSEISEWISSEIKKKKISDLRSQNLPSVKGDKVQQNTRQNPDRFKAKPLPTNGNNASRENAAMENFPQKIDALQKTETDNTEKIKLIVELKKIKYLVHFTSFENLNSILENGLIPKRTLQEKNISFVHNDDQRLENRPDCTSLSISFPNYQLFFKFRRDYPQKRWVVIVLDVDVLFSDRNITYFCHTNAARVLPHCIDLEKLRKADSFEEMFYESIKSKKDLKRTSLKIDDNMTNDPQAEILISGIIGTEYIRCIHFEDQSDIDIFSSEYGNDLLEQYKYLISPDYFKYRKDCGFWRKEQ